MKHNATILPIQPGCETRKRRRQDDEGDEGSHQGEGRQRKTTNVSKVHCK
jgi:hypothetical protein